MIKVLNELLSMGAAADICCQSDWLQLQLVDGGFLLVPPHLLVEHGAEITQESVNVETV